MRKSLCSILLLVLVVALAACKKTNEAEKPPNSLSTPTPDAAFHAPVTVIPVPTPTSIPTLPSIQSIVDAILLEEIRSVRIFERSVNDYPADQPPLFSEPNAKVMVFPKTIVPFTPEQLSDLPNRIKVTAKSSQKEVRYSVDPIKPGDSNLVPLSLQLQDAPEEDLLIRFYSTDGQQEKTLTLRYTEPFRYTLTSEDDPGIVPYAADSKKGFYKTHYVLPGQTYEYSIQFSHDVRRDSVTQRLAESAGKEASPFMQFKWENDRLLKLTLDFRQPAQSPAITFNLYGIRTKDGYQISDQANYRIQPARPQALFQINLPASAKQSLFASPVHYTEIEMSPNGKYGLAAELGSNEMYSLYAYSVVELNGNRLQAFDMDEIYLAKWYRDGSTLLYLQHNKFMQYDTTKGEVKTIWTSPSQEKNARFVSLDLDPTTGSISVGWGLHDEQGQFTYDLYVFKSPVDTEPRRIPNAATFDCYEGPCYAPGERMFRNGNVEVVVKRPEEADDTKRVIELTNRKSLWIVKMPDAGSEQWVLFDPITNAQTTLMDTKLGIFKSWTPLTEIGEGQYLIHLPDQHWQIVDTTHQTVSVYDLIPKEVNQVHKMGTDLYFFSVEH